MINEKNDEVTEKVIELRKELGDVIFKRKDGITVVMNAIANLYTTCCESIIETSSEENIKIMLYQLQTITDDIKNLVKVKNKKN